MLEDWLLNLPLGWMALIIFGGTYLVAAFIHFAVTRLAVNDRRAHAFQGLSSGMLPSLALIFARLVGFIASQVWNDFDRAKLAVATEASALRAASLLAEGLPAEQASRLRSLIDRHIEVALQEDWPAMAQQRATLASAPAALIEALKTTLALPADEAGQRTAQREIVKALETALEAHRQSIVISHSEVSSLKWAGLLLQALCTLIAIALVHGDNSNASGIALALFATGVALSVLLIAAYSRPFTGDISVGPDLLKEVQATLGASP
jgi:positive regulator of sigma E activity